MLKTTIIKVLESCRQVKKAMPDGLLRRECELRLDTRIGDHQFQQTISEMINAGQVALEFNPATLEPRYKIGAQALA